MDHADVPPIRRVLAPNPSELTGAGTNTYIVGQGTVAVIDPGPLIDSHADAILAALAPGERIGQILVTHTHLDHAPLARPLAARTGAPVLAFGDWQAGRSAAMAGLAGADLGGGEGLDRDFRPDAILADGAVVAGDGWRIEAIHTPGHLGNHLCFALGDVCFSGDHVMGWATSLVSPPDGDMGQYMASLDRLAARRWSRFLPGHGAAIEDPAARIQDLIAHRRGREAQILAALEDGPADVAGLTARIYHGIPPGLVSAARRNVLAHLLDLLDKNRVTADRPPSPGTRYARP